MLSALMSTDVFFAIFFFVKLFVSYHPEIPRLSIFMFVFFFSTR